MKQLSPAGEGISFDVIAFIRGLLRHILPSRQIALEEAAAILNVPETYLETLLDEKRIPHARTEKGRQIRYGDLLEYKRQRDRKRRQGLTRTSSKFYRC